MRFRMDDFFGPVVDDPPPGQKILAGWICTDVGLHFRALLDALAMVDDVKQGRPPFEPWTSEGYGVAFTTEGVTIRSLHGERESATYNVDDVATMLEEYWHFLAGLPERSDSPRPFRPDLPEWQARLLLWEESWELRHPYRGRLGIPAEGPA